jgi:hypothetical protein
MQRVWVVVPRPMCWGPIQLIAGKPLATVTGGAPTWHPHLQTTCNLDSCTLANVYAPTMNVGWVVLPTWHVLWHANGHASSPHGTCMTPWGPRMVPTTLKTRQHPFMYSIACVDTVHAESLGGCAQPPCVGAPYSQQPTTVSC